MKKVSGNTKVVGIIGAPVRHSLSPVMQNAAFVACSLDYIYVPFAVRPENLEQAVNGLKVLGVCGFNVTIPHKTAIIPYLNRLDESAVSAGAVNTVLLRGAELIGYNTDGDGLVDSLYRDLGYVCGNGQILVVGAGGAARGAIAALCRSGAGKIVIMNRTLENAYAIKADMNIRYPATSIEATGFNQIENNCLGTTELLINTTSIGMNGECIDSINIELLPMHARVYDMVYSASGTPLVKEAVERGLPAVNGLGMLVAQGERAFEIWTGCKPPEGVMRQALHCI